MPSPKFTGASGFGPLPRLLENIVGKWKMARVFQSEGLSASIASEPDRWVPLQVLIGIFERSADAAADDMFGLRVGQQMRPEDFGLFAQYATSAPDVRTMIWRTNRSIIYHQTGTIFGLDVNGNVARWCYRVLDGGKLRQRHHAEHILWPMLTALRSYLGKDWNPTAIECNYPRPACWRDIEQAFFTPVIFGKSANALVFASRVLNARRVSSVSSKDQITYGDVRRMVGRRPPTTIVESVRHMVRTRLAEPSVDIEGTARLLNMSTRSLQRHLGEENLTFRAMLEQIRVQRALELLQETDASITEIAFGLGYNDPTSFTRAFKRLTGRPPVRSRTKSASFE